MGTSILRKLMLLLSREAPAQAANARKALLGAKRSGSEHSVIGAADRRIGGNITEGDPYGVDPDEEDISQAKKSGRPVFDFHTHPSVKHKFNASPSQEDFDFWSTQYEDLPKQTELRTLIATYPHSMPEENLLFFIKDDRSFRPATNRDLIDYIKSTPGNRAKQTIMTASEQPSGGFREVGYDELVSLTKPGPRSRPSYNFFATTDRQVFNPDDILAAQFELSQAAKRGTLDAARMDPSMRAYFQTVDPGMSDFLPDAAPLLLLKRRAEQGRGRSEILTGGRTLTSDPAATEQRLLDLLTPSALQVLRDKKLSHGGPVRAR